MGMRVDIVTLFPEMCQQVLDASILGRAAKRGYIETHCHQIRDYTLNKQKQTDGSPISPTNRLQRYCHSAKDTSFSSIHQAYFNIQFG